MPSVFHLLSWNIRPLKKNLKPVLGQIGVVNMARDAMGAMKAL